VCDAAPVGSITLPLAGGLLLAGVLIARIWAARRSRARPARARRALDPISRGLVAAVLVFLVLLGLLAYIYATAPAVCGTMLLGACLAPVPNPLIMPVELLLAGVPPAAFTLVWVLARAPRTAAPAINEAP